MRGSQINHQCADRMHFPALLHEVSKMFLGWYYYELLNVRSSKIIAEHLRKKVFPAQDRVYFGAACYLKRDFRTYLLGTMNECKRRTVCLLDKSEAFLMQDMKPMFTAVSFEFAKPIRCFCGLSVVSL